MDHFSILTPIHSLPNPNTHPGNSSLTGSNLRETSWVMDIQCFLPVSPKPTSPPVFPHRVSRSRAATEPYRSWDCRHTSFVSPGTFWGTAHHCLSTILWAGWKATGMHFMEDSKVPSCLGVCFVACWFFFWANQVCQLWVEWKRRIRCLRTSLNKCLRDFRLSTKPGAPSQTTTRKEGQMPFILETNTTVFFLRIMYR